MNNFNSITSIIYFIALLVFSTVQAQYNPGLTDTTKRWSTIDQYTAGGGIPYSFFNKFSGDTLVGNVAYLKVWTSFDEMMADWELSGFIREE